MWPCWSQDVFTLGYAKRISLTEINCCLVLLKPICSVRFQSEIHIFNIMTIGSLKKHLTLSTRCSARASAPTTRSSATWTSASTPTTLRSRPTWTRTTCRLTPTSRWRSSPNWENRRVGDDESRCPMFTPTTTLFPRRVFSHVFAPQRDGASDVFTRFCFWQPVVKQYLLRW